MQRNNYFYSALGGFLQSSVQGIKLQTTLGGGMGRYFKNSNRVRLAVVGGFVWQSAGLPGFRSPRHTSANLWRRDRDRPASVLVQEKPT